MKLDLVTSWLNINMRVVKNLLKIKMKWCKIQLKKSRGITIFLPPNPDFYQA